ncbi:hypothetical protein ES708_23593 [subsurface metagenome]
MSLRLTLSIADSQKSHKLRAVDCRTFVRWTRPALGAPLRAATDRAHWPAAEGRALLGSNLSAAAGPLANGLDLRSSAFPLAASAHRRSPDPARSLHPLGVQPVAKGDKSHGQLWLDMSLPRTIPLQQPWRAEVAHG